jgi:hypothetical protein
VQTGRRLFVAALVVALTLTTAGTAFAKNNHHHHHHHHYPPDAVSVGVSDSTVTPGEAITVTGDRWKAGGTIHLEFHSTPVQLGTAKARADGTFSATVTIPSTATAGTHTILAAGIGADGAQHTARTTIEVLGVVTAGGSTAFTGAAVRVWMFLAISLFGVGLGLVLVSRRRRTSVLP